MNTRNVSTSNGSFAFNGSQTNDSMVDFMLGRLSSFSQANVDEAGLRQRYAGLYIQDDIRATKRLARSLEGERKARALMQLALASDGLGREDAARDNWDAALASAPDDREVATAAVVFFMSRARWSDASRVA
mgnify:CR=1 FL=1